MEIHDKIMTFNFDICELNVFYGNRQFMETDN